MLTLLCGSRWGVRNTANPWFRPRGRKDFGELDSYDQIHISLEARERYQFPDALFSYDGNVVFADMSGCRRFARQMNLVRETDKNPESAVHAGALFAMGLIDEASHVVMTRYREQYDRNVMADALAFFGEQTSPEALDKLLLAFVDHFPGQSVMRGERLPQQWLQGSTDGVP